MLAALAFNTPGAAVVAPRSGVERDAAKLTLIKRLVSFALVLKYQTYIRVGSSGAQVKASYFTQSWKCLSVRPASRSASLSAEFLPAVARVFRVRACPAGRMTDGS